MPLVEKLNRARSNTAESDEALGAIRAKPKHRALPPVKFVLKVRWCHDPTSWLRTRQRR